MIKVGIVGGTGYTGVELLRLLAAHPDVQLKAITSLKRYLPAMGSIDLRLESKILHKILNRQPIRRDRQL